MNESSRPKPFRSAPHDELLPSSPLARRDFLKLVGATTAVAGVAPFLGGPRSASAQRPQSVKVLLEDLRLDAAGLAGGGLDGVAATTAGLVLTSGSGRGQYMSPVLTGRNPFTH